MFKRGTILPGTKISLPLTFEAPFLFFFNLARSISILFLKSQLVVLAIPLFSVYFCFLFPSLCIFLNSRLRSFKRKNMDGKKTLTSEWCFFPKKGRGRDLGNNNEGLEM